MSQPFALRAVPTKRPILTFWIVSLLGAALTHAQTVSSSVTAVVLDTSGAVIAAATCELLSTSTGVRLTASSASDGSVTFPRVPPGTYTLKVQAPGFKALELQNVIVTPSEIRTLGKLVLQVGEVRESVSVTAETAAIQLATAERSGMLTGSQLNEIALKGRDFFAMLQTIPGIVDTNASRETTSEAAISGLYINGARDNQKMVSVDGMVAHDTHSNGSMPFEPNMDSIAEVKVLTSNYQAEYGRNSAAVISVVTKSGTREFHGSGYNFYRHETLNANNFFNNRTATRKLPYRYRISGFSIGGPIYIPAKFNSDKDKLFFFWSREYTGVKRDYGSQFVNTPTAAEREGDFSRSFDVNGALIPIRDPLTAQPFPANRIPKDRISRLGAAILSFFPLPNFTDPDPRNAYRWNYRSVYSGNAPRRNEILRIDANVTAALRMYYRFIREPRPLSVPWGDWKAGSINWLMDPVRVEDRGQGHLLQVTRTFSATLVSETTLGYTMRARDFDFTHPDVVARSRMGNPPQWYADPAVPDYVPNVSFGGQPANTINAALTAQIPNRYRNPVVSFTSHLSQVRGSHRVKSGISVERTLARAPTGGYFRGVFAFARDTNNPFESNHSFANALLGNFASYTETSRRNDTRQLFWNAEWYLQDNWVLTKRFTVDLGVRFYHMPPIRELNNLAATFDPALYEPRKAPALYVPGRDSAGRRVALDPLTGVTTYAALIGQYVPGTGDPANGMAVGGRGGYPAGLYTRPWVNYGPRVGVAYDLFGDGKTALRAGWGWFYDTGQNNPFSNTTGNPPISYTPVLYYGNLESYALGGGVIGPSNLSIISGRHKTPNTMNYSVGLQRQLWGTVLDAAYVGALSRHLFLVRNINPIGMYARFNPANEDPTQPGKPLPDNFLRPFKGYGNLSQYENAGTANYNSLQVSVNRRFTRGLQFGVAYTYSKVLGVASTDTESVSPYFPERHRNYGPLSFDRRQVVVINYIYQLPKVSQWLRAEPVRWVLDSWFLSGITSFLTGAPFTPGFTTVDGADITGSTEGARITVTADPRLPRGERTFYRNFKTEVFQRTPLGDFGNAGVGLLYGPGVNNWDLSISKRVPLRSEERYVQFRTEMFNAWNHTQFSGLYTTARFDLSGRQVDPNFGAYSSARAARIIQLSLKLVF